MHAGPEIGVAATKSFTSQVVILTLLAFLLVANQAAAASMTTNGSSALALAALVAPHGRTLGVVDRVALARLFSGRTNFGYPANRKIMVSADAIDCRVSNVDIGAA